jgi:pyruvoyl-dependent arginine decarboxylase (PvlArgDC)
MIKSVKRLGAAVLSAVMMLTAVATPLASAAAEGTFPESVTGETENNNVVTATADDSGLVYGDNGTLTKAEWLHDLVTVFDMKVEEGDPPDNYFTDVAYDSEYYDDIMLATEFGVVNVEAGGELGPDDTVDREYASVTLNFCLGFQLDDDTYTFSESSDEAYADELTAFQVALNRNWFALSGGAFLPSKAITSAEAKAMLSDAQQVLADAQIDDTKEGTFEFADYVIDFTPYQVVEFDEDNTVTIYAPDKKLAVGDTFVVYDQELPFVYTATAIKTDGSDIIVTTTDAPDDAIVNYVAEGTIKADIATFNPADNVDVTYVKDDATALTMSKARGVTVTKDSIMVDMKIPISSGIDVSVSCDLKNIALHHKENMRDGYYYASVTGETTLTTSLNIDPLKGSGVSGKYYLGYISTGAFSASLYAELSLSGKLMTVYTGNFEVGVSYQRFKGFRVIKSFTKKSFNFCADISAKVAMTAECKIDIVVLEAKANVSIGIQAKYNKKVYGDDKLPGICEDIQAYLYAGGSISATIIKVATFSKSFDFIDKNNSPYRLYLHYDDGNQVDVCGRDISDPSSPTPVRRYTSPSSTGFGSRWSSSQSSKWHSGSNGSSAQQPEKLWEYSLDDDKNATITAYNGYSSSLVIPTKIDGYTVTKIGDRAFEYNTRLVMVVIPDSVTVIGIQAFYECKNLSSVTLSKGLVDLQQQAFGECTKLTSITIPKSLERCYDGGWGGAFDNSGLNQVNFEEGITAIPSYLFADTIALETIVIPDTVTSIGDGAFRESSALKNAIISDSVTVIGIQAFYGCKNLSSVTLSKGLVDLQQQAFGECTKLTSITIPKSLERSSDGIYGGAFDHSGLATVKFEDGVKMIPNYLFADATTLETIVIPDSVTSIGVYSFANCSALKNITIPYSVTEIDAQAFYKCTSLKTIAIPDSIKTLDDGTFFGCNSLSNIKFPSLITEIGSGMCDGCTSLVTVEMGDKVTSIGDNAFQNCTSLKNITLSPETEYINSNAFSNCDSLESIVIPDKVTVIYHNAFSDCDKLLSVTLSKALKQIGESAFNNCDSLTAIKIPDSVETIGERAFYGCEKLADVNMGNGVSKLYSEAFRLCPALTKIVLSNNLTSIPEYAFADCTKLTDVTIYPGVTEIATNAFSYPAKTTMRGLKGSYAETYANDRGMTFETITSVDASMLTVKFKNDYDGYEAAPSYTYTGKPFKPDVKVYLGSYELTAGTDYKIVSYKNNTKIGTATCTIQGLGTYTGTTTGSFTIAPIPLPGYSWYYSLEYSNYDYTGKEIRPAVTCEGLTEGIDFTVSYKDNINAGTAQVIITGIGNYSGTYTLEFTINPVTICTDVSQLQSKHPYDENVHEVYVYNGAEGAENLYLTFSDDTQFEEYCDYLYIYDANGYEVGSYTGDELSGRTITVPGSYVKLVLNTDSSNNEYGFRVVSASDKLECATHVFGDWKITEEATCTTTGTKTRACTVCGKVETVTIAKTAHKYVNTVVKPTYTAQGYTLHKCSVCGYSYKDNYMPALKPTELTGVKVKTQGSTSLTLAWDKNASAKGYIIEQYKGGKWTQIAKTSSNATVTYTVNGLKADTTYTFRIKAYAISGESEIYSDYVRIAGKTRIANVASFKGSAVSASAVKLDWSKNDKATGYVIEQYRGGKWTVLATTKNNTTLTFTVKGLAEGTAYSFRLKSLKTANGVTEESVYTSIKAATAVSGVKNAKVTSVTGSWITLEWAKNDKATGYSIEQYKGGKWTVIATTKNNATLKFTVKGLKNDTTYSFRIRAYKTSGSVTAYSDYVRIAGKTRIPNVAKFTGSAVSASAVKLDWSKNDKATGYVIEQYKGGKWTALATTKNNTTLTFTVKGLAKGTTYSFRIKSFRKTGGTTEFSEYASVKAATDK